MAATPEAKVKDHIKKILDLHNAYRVMPVSNGMGAHGIPDFLVCVYGRFVGIEAKAGGNLPTELQLSNLRRLHEAGGSAMVINEQNLPFLDGLLNVLKIGGKQVSNYETFMREHEPETDAPRKRTKEKKHE